MQETGRAGSIPDSGRSPGGGNCNPLRYSCLENSMGSGAWQAKGPKGWKESGMTEHTHAWGLGSSGEQTELKLSPLMIDDRCIRNTPSHPVCGPHLVVGHFNTASLPLLLKLHPHPLQQLPRTTYILEEPTHEVTRRKNEKCTWYVLLWAFSYLWDMKPPGFPGGSVVQSVCQAGDPGCIPWSGGAPGVGNGNPLQLSCLENCVDRRAWWATAHGRKESDTTEWKSRNSLFFQGLGGAGGEESIYQFWSHLETLLKTLLWILGKNLRCFLSDI